AAGGAHRARPAGGRTGRRARHLGRRPQAALRRPLASALIPRWNALLMDRLQAMEMFVRVVETGSFSKAAREFNTTQPTVTKQVAATEARLKVRLLNRNTRGVSLTESGALYYEKCKAIVRDAEEAESIVKLRQSQAQGLLRIGTSTAFGRRVVVPLALEFMARHPQVQVDLSFEDRYVDL